MNSTAGYLLSPEALCLFDDYAKDACNWGGTPLVGANVPHKPAYWGFLTALKKADLITTYLDAKLTWLQFTAKGVEFAASRGIKIPV